MVLDDFVMLGRTEPAESKKHGACVCSAGYSRELRQFVRIYPLPIVTQLNAWTRARVPLRRPTDDNRYESWRINADAPDTNAAELSLRITGSAQKDQEFDFLASMASGSIKELNDQRRSLGIIKPAALEWDFRRRGNMDPLDQEVLFERLQPDGPLERSDLSPVLGFKDNAGWHELQLKEWGCARYLVKNREKANELWSALRLDKPEYEHLLFVGNQNHQRTSWLVIKVVSRRKVTQVNLFEEDAHAAA